MFDLITWLVTRKCGLKCDICNFVTDIPDPPVEKKIEALEIFKSWEGYSDRFICLLGGDISFMEDVPDFLGTMNYLNLPYGFQTSAIRTSLMKQVYMDLHNLSISADFVTFKEDKWRYLKEFCGLGWAKKCKEINPGVDVHATVTIDKLNVNRVAKGIMRLSDLGIWSELTFLHWKKPGFDLVFDMKDQAASIDDVKRLADQVLSLKQLGYLVHSSVEFISSWETYLGGLSWRCDHPYVLMLDADLTMRMCLHHPGRRVRDWSIFHLKNQSSWLIFLKVWEEDRLELCPSCFWDCQFEICNSKKNPIKWVDHRG